MTEHTDLRLQDAGAGLAELEPGSVDLAFIDGVKGDYAAHLELALQTVALPRLPKIAAAKALRGTRSGQPAAADPEHGRLLPPEGLLPVRAACGKTARAVRKGGRR